MFRKGERTLFKTIILTFLNHVVAVIFHMLFLNVATKKPMKHCIFLPTRSL